MAKTEKGHRNGVFNYWAWALEISTRFNFPCVVTNFY